MSAVWTLFKREMQALFLSPIAYLVAVAGSAFMGWSFVWILSIVADAQQTNQQRLMTVFFGGNIFFWMFQVMLAPAITMRLFAEEKRTGTLEALLTAPVTDVQVVLSKFLSALAFYGILLVPTALGFALLGAKGLDLGMFASAYLGLLLVGALYLSVGCLVSSLCTSQLVSAILSFMVLVILTFGPLVATGKKLEPAWVADAVRYLNLVPFSDRSLMGDFGRGLVTVGHLAYPLSITLCCLFLTCKVLSSRSWR